MILGFFYITIWGDVWMLDIALSLHRTFNREITLLPKLIICGVFGEIMIFPYHYIR